MSDHDQLPSLLALAADDFERKLQAGGDAQAAQRMAIIRQFVRHADASLTAIGLSQFRYRGDGYVGVLTDGREFALMGSETAARQSGTMQEMPYAPIGAGAREHNGMLGSIPATSPQHY